MTLPPDTAPRRRGRRHAHAGACKQATGNGKEHKPQAAQGPLPKGIQTHDTHPHDDGMKAAEVPVTCEGILLTDDIFFGFAEEVPDWDNGAAASAEIPEGAEVELDALADFADDAGAPATHLEPNRSDINKHLYALFHPDFVMPRPDAWIEIAIANPRAGKGNTGPKGSEHFSAFDLQAAGDFAERQNRKGRNVYVGVALRQGTTGPSGRATKANVMTAARGWADFDKMGDAAHIYTFLHQRKVGASEVVITGTVPHKRLQVFFRLVDGATPDEIEAVNEVLKTSLGGNGDGVQNSDRLMRLAGTVSWPPPRKVERGYVPEVTKLSPPPIRAPIVPTS